MTWRTASDPFAEGPTTEGRVETVELIGLHLRLSASIALGRFHRLSDFVNASRGYVRVRDARLIAGDGTPIGAVLPEIMVDEDAISFIAQTEVSVASDHDQVGGGGSDGPAPQRHGDIWDTGTGTDSEPTLTFSGEPAVRAARRFVLLTTGHMLTGAIHLFGDTDLAGFVASTDPRYVPVTDAVVRSLMDPSDETSYPFLLLNRTAMVGASEAPED